METDNDTETETSQVEETPIEQNEQSKDSKPITNFLEFGEMKNGEHSIALVKEPGEARATMVAKIHADFAGEPKRASYTARDREGNILFTSPKLYELKKNIKEQAKPLLEKARIAKEAWIKTQQQKKEEPLLEKEAKDIGKRLGNETLDIAKSAHNVAHELIGGNSRSSEIKSIRSKKVQKSKDLHR